MAGVILSTIGLLLAHKKIKGWRLFKIWVAGASLSILLWIIFIKISISMPESHGSPYIKEWSIFFNAVALWDTLPGIALAGGRITHFFSLFFIKKN